MRFRPTVPRQDPWGPGPVRLRPGEPHDQHPAYAAPTEPSQTGSSDCQTIQNCLFSMFCHYKLTSKYYGHVYNFFRRANPLRGGLGPGARDICGPCEIA